MIAADYGLVKIDCCDAHCVGLTRRHGTLSLIEIRSIAQTFASRCNLFRKVAPPVKL